MPCLARVWEYASVMRYLVDFEAGDRHEPG
jgi:hypothetical protein